MSLREAPVRAEEPDFWTPDIRVETRPDGTILMREAGALGPYPRTITERFFAWSRAAPRRSWIAERGPDGDWQHLTYGDAARRIEALAAGLMSLGLSAERPLLILSGNSVPHALMALAAQHVGIPSAALAPAYATTGGDFTKLRAVSEQLTPGAVFVDKADVYAAAIARVFPKNVPVITQQGSVPGHIRLDFKALEQTHVGPAVAAAHESVGPETVAKFLFTSGTTGRPKAVIQTQGMLCANQAMVAAAYAFVQREPPVLIDWAPWNHTASGNKFFNLVIYNGGTLYIDGGRPTPAGIGQTIANLKEVSPTWYFNVPIGYQMLLEAIEQDAELRGSLFRRLKILFYAGSGLSQPLWERLTRVAGQAVQGGVLIATAFGSTETGPLALACTTRQTRAGHLGVPVRGTVLKLVPRGESFEARVRGPAVTPGYWRDPDLSAEAFDAEGFYCFGDAMRLADPRDPSKGVLFDGRLAENFKLATGTWVSVGALRAGLTNALGGLASDVVLAGEGRAEIGALVLPNWEAVRALAGADGAAALDHPAVRRALQDRLQAFAQSATGSAKRVTRVLFLDRPLSFDAGEVTDKGSVNQRAVLRNRREALALLWSDDPRVVIA